MQRSFTWPRGISLNPLCSNGRVAGSEDERAIACLAPAVRADDVAGQPFAQTTGTLVSKDEDRMGESSRN